MEMHQVRYFLALSETLSFTEAAARCNVAQPSLTRAVKLLEAEFGGLLFNRQRGNIQITELGRMILPYLQEVSVQAHAAKERAEDLRKMNAKRLRLGVMCTIAPDPLLTLVQAMHKEHPDVDLEIVDQTARRLEEQLLGGLLDVCLFCRPGRPNSRLHYIKVFDEQMIIALKSTDPLARRRELRHDDLREQRYLNRINCEFNGADIPGSTKSSWQTVYRSERDDWILAMVAAGMGFAYMPRNCAKHPGVVVRRLVDPEVIRQVDLATVRGRLFPSALGAVVREAARNKWSVS